MEGPEAEAEERRLRRKARIWALICIALCLAALPLFLVFAAIGVP